MPGGYKPKLRTLKSSLIEQAQHGDRNAFGELVRRHYQGVVLVVTRMCGDTGLAEDAAQEAFMRAWVNLRSFQTKGSLRNWLYRIAINAALDVLRHKPEETPRRRGNAGDGGPGSGSRNRADRKRTDSPGTTGAEVAAGGIPLGADPEGVRRTLLPGNRRTCWTCRSARSCPA